MSEIDREILVKSEFKHIRDWSVTGKDYAAVESYKYADALRIIKRLLDDSECYCPNPEESFGRGPCAFCEAKEFLSKIRAGKGEK